MAPNFRQKKARSDDLAFKNTFLKKSLPTDRQAPLDRSDILGLWTFLALGYREFNLLSFGQSFETCALDCAEMSEYVGS